ncbi:MAG: hypothetical protein APR55_08750 [Methanolinea sp. SDB]|nr:MAG: hypothetical protein APR55_08750 [Methanolinea sp. SDB]
MKRGFQNVWYPDSEISPPWLRKALEKIVRTGDESAARVNVPGCRVGKEGVIIRVEDEQQRA